MGIVGSREHHEPDPLRAFYVWSISVENEDDYQLLLV